MMLRHPIALETQCFAMRGDIAGIGQRSADSAAFENGDEIEKREFGHDFDVVPDFSKNKGGGRSKQGKIINTQPFVTPSICRPDR